MAKLKVVHKWVGSGRIHSFMLIMGRVVLGHFTCGSGWVEKIGPTPNSASYLHKKCDDDIKRLTTNEQTNTHTHMHRQTLLKTTPPRYTIAERVVNIALRKKLARPPPVRLWRPRYNGR